MKKYFIIVAALLSLSLSASAKRTQADWKGRVLDERGEGLPYVNVVILSLPDSIAVGGTITDSDGSYAVSAEKDNAVLMVAMLGYETRYVKFADCSEIHMELTSEMLGGSVVSAVMPKTKLTDQGMLTSVKGSVLETAGTAKDALSKVPGLIRGKDGLEVLGKGAPLIYINGRRVADVTELDRLQSNEIQSVEVISNPGAQYAANVKAVVRIKTVRHQGDGFGFNVGMSDEQSLRNRINDPSVYADFNFRHNGLDVFAGGNYLKYTSRQQSDMQQETIGAKTFLQKGTLDFTQTMTNLQTNGGLNWQISDNHSLGFRFDYGRNGREDQDQMLIQDVFEDGSLIDHIIAEGHHRIGKVPQNLGVNAYYSGQAGKLGIDFNADYYGVSTSQVAHTSEKSEMSHDDDIRPESSSNARLYATKLVFTYPVWKGSLQAGTEETFSRSGNEYRIESTMVPSSKSEAREDNVALFASYGFYLPKVGQFSAGLRYEHVGYEFDDMVGTDDLARRYDNIFPSLMYANSFGPVQVQLSYGAKTVRPDFSQLSSAIRYHSRFILQSGNPQLQPQVSHDLGFTAHWKFLTAVAQYSRVEDAISQWSSPYNDSGVTIVRSVNLDSPFHQGAFFVNASPSIGNWSLNYTAGVQPQWLSLEANGRHLQFNDKPMWVVQLFNTYRTKKGSWQFEFGGEFHSRAYVMNSEMTNTYFDLSAAVQKSLFGDALVIRLSGKDLAGMGRYDVRADCGGHVINQTNILDTKRLVLSVRYSFNTAASKYRGTGAGKDAMDRMKK